VAPPDALGTPRPTRGGNIRNGDRLYIDGRIEYDSFEKSGVTVPTAEVVVRELVLHGVPQSGSSGYPDEHDDDEMPDRDSAGGEAGLRLLARAGGRGVRVGRRGESARAAERCTAWVHDWAGVGTCHAADSAFRSRTSRTSTASDRGAPWHVPCGWREAGGRVARGHVLHAA
jgi:hypothetical protein